MPEPDPGPPVGLIRRTVGLVALLNLGYFFVEFGVAVAIGSVALFADSVDFLEDTAVNALIFIALTWTLRRRAQLGRLLAVIILVPALAAGWQLISRVADPRPPDAALLILTAGGAVLVNTAAALLLARVRRHSGSLATAAFLSARNDVVVNLAIIAMGLLTAATGSGWPDLVLGAIIIVLNGSGALEVWRLAGEERLAARALAGELDDDD